MSIFEKANEILGQVVGYATVSLGDIIGSTFMRLVMFFIELLLGL